MDATWANLLSGFVGAVVGGLLALLGSLKVMSHERAMQTERELALHRAAVRAVVIELTSNSVALAAIQHGGLAADHAVTDTTAYDALLVPLYSLLPTETAAPVARSYSRLHIFKAKPIIIATEHRGYIDDGLNALVTYAQKKLQMDLSVPP